jgi:hypothetical protein
MGSTDEELEIAFMCMWKSPAVSGAHVINVAHMIFGKVLTGCILIHNITFIENKIFVEVFFVR